MLVRLEAVLTLPAETRPCSTLCNISTTLALHLRATQQNPACMKHVVAIHNVAVASLSLCQTPLSNVASFDVV